MDVSSTDTAARPAVPARPAVSTLTFPQRIKSIFSGSVGNLLEWYDWYAYSAFSLYFAKSFFPSGSGTEQLLNTAAIFAVGFLMRPIGGWLFGLYADKRGRRAALLLSVCMMCGGSLIIAVCPTHASIGIGAPVLLVFARLLQGLSLGGEYGTSAAYLAEMATPKHRGFYASFQYVTLIMGQLVAIALLVLLQRVLLSSAELEAWGWRIPFVIGAIISVVVLYLRSAMTESVLDGILDRNGRAGHRERLYVDQRDRQGGDVPCRDSRTRRRFSVCNRRLGVRRHDRIPRALAQERRTRKLVLPVRDRVYLLFAAGLWIHAGNARSLDAGSRLIPGLHHR